MPAKTGASVFILSQRGAETTSLPGSLLVFSQQLTYQAIPWMLSTIFEDLPAAVTEVLESARMIMDLSGVSEFRGHAIVSTAANAGAVVRFIMSVDGGATFTPIGDDLAIDAAEIVTTGWVPLSLVRQVDSVLISAETEDGDGAADPVISLIFEVR